MEKINQEQKALQEIKRIEDEIQKRLDSTEKKATEIIAKAREKANELIRQKEARLAEVRQSSVREESLFPEKIKNGDQEELKSPSPAAVREIAQELFELLIT